VKPKIKTLHPLLCVFAAVTVASAADVPAQPIAKKGAAVFSDEFEHSELRAKWKVTTPTFVIADGVLRCSHGGLLWVSYDSSHEGKTCVYLAKVRLPGVTAE
jgi:hypothetical protein